MVRVLAVADEEVPSVQSRVRDVRVDLVLAAGDLPWDYLESLVSLLGAPAAYVPGNHDPRTGHGVGPRGLVDVDGHVQHGRRPADRRPRRVRPLQRRPAPVHPEGVRQSCPRAAREARDAEVDVLLTHAPPLGLGDESDPPHVGISALHGVLETLRPSWHLHGHIHPYGMHKPDRQLGSTTIRNVIPWQLIDIEPRSAATATATAGRRA